MKAIFIIAMVLVAFAFYASADPCPGYTLCTILNGVPQPDKCSCSAGQHGTCVLGANLQLSNPPHDCLSAVVCVCVPN